MDILYTLQEEQREQAKSLNKLAGFAKTTYRFIRYL